MNANWRKRPKLDELDALVEMARDKSAAGREALTATVTDLFADTNQVMSDSERALTEGILHQLINDVEASVRKGLADRLSKLDNAPSGLIVLLANDEISVALPILQRSTVLQDEELVEIVRHKSMSHQLAIAMRDSISEPVCDALAETDNEAVVVTLLQNKTARISSETMSNLVNESEKKPRYQEPLLRRDDLHPDLAKRMYWWVSAALRVHLLEKFEIDPAELDDAIENTVETAMEQHTGYKKKHAGFIKDTANETLTDLLAYSEVAGDRLIKLLRDGKVTLFITLFANKIGIRTTLAKRILFEPGGEGLAIACRAVGMEPKIFSAIYRLTRAATDKNSDLPRGELVRIASLYLDIRQDQAQIVVRNWQRDPEYLWAIKQVTGEAGQSVTPIGAAANG